MPLVDNHAVRYDFSLLTDYDPHLFNEGNHNSLYDKMGAHLATVQGQRGTYFAIWAPNAYGSHPDVQTIAEESTTWPMVSKPTHDDTFTEKIPGHVESESVPPPCPDAAAESWRQRLPLVVLRIRNLAADDQTYPWAAFEQRNPSEPPETWYNAPPQNYLDTLTQAVCNSWNKAGTTQDCSQWTKLLNLQRDLRLTGPDCVLAWMNCLAPTEDAAYLMSGRLPLDSEHFYAVVGPLSTATDNATYVGLGLNSSLKQLAFDTISDEQVAGSATGYSNAVPGDKFFVQYIARDCSGLVEQLPAGTTLHCYSIKNKVPDCNNLSDPQCDMLVLSLRGYIRPTTQRGSDPTSVLNSRYILLKKP